MSKYKCIFFFVGCLYLCSCSTVSWGLKSRPKVYSHSKRTINKDYLQEQASYHYLLAELSMLEGRASQSLLQIKNAQLYDAKNLALKVREIELFLEKGDLYQGLDQLDTLLQVYLKEPSLLELKGKIYEALKSYKSAAAIYKGLPKSDPVLLTQIRLAFLQKHFKKVIFLAKQARFKQDSFLFEAHYYLAQSFEANGQPKQAKKVYENSLKSQLNTELFLVFAFADFYKKQKKINKELQVLLKYKEQVAEPYLVLQRLFSIYVERGENKKALIYAESLLAEGVKDLSFQFQVSLLFIGEMQYQKATLLLENILSIDPTLDRVQFYLGLMYKQTAQVKKAKKIFSSITPQSEYYFEAVKVHYYFLNQEKKTLSAEELLKTAFTQKNLPKKTKKDLGYLLVLHYESHKKFPQALEYAQQLVDDFPNFVSALNYVAYKWIDKDLHLIKAEKLITKAHKLDPNNPFVIDTMGWLLFKKGEYKQAKNYLQLAYNKDPSLEVAEHLGDVYKQLNKLNIAGRFYAEAFNFAQTHGDKKRLKNKLDLLSLVQSKKKNISSNVIKSTIESRQPSSTSSTTPSTTVVK